MIWAVVAGAVCLAALAGVSGVAFYFSGRAVHIKIHSVEDVVAAEFRSGNIAPEHIETLPKEEIRIASPYGYTLYGWLVPPEGGAPAGPVPTVIFVHGVKSSLHSMLKYAAIFRSRGFRALLYDQRRHGRSGGTNTTYGFYEKYDLQAVVDWVLDRFGSDAAVGVFGESMGAATALLHAAVDPRPKFVVADCAYSSLWEQLTLRLRAEYRLPRFPVLALTDVICRLRAGFWFGQVSPVRAVSGVDAPVLFIHGQDDNFVPRRMSEALHAAKPGPKSLYLAPNAGHAGSWVSDKEAYERAVDEFLRRHALAPAAAEGGGKDAVSTTGANVSQGAIPAKGGTGHGE